MGPMTVPNPTRSGVDRILAAIDAGLQSSPEASFGEHTFNRSDAGPVRCVRCNDPLRDDASGEFCSACRSFLLGDSDVDPGRNPGRNPWIVGELWDAATTIVDVSGDFERAFSDWSSPSPSARWLDGQTVTVVINGDRHEARVTFNHIDNVTP